MRARPVWAYYAARLLDGDVIPDHGYAGIDVSLGHVEVDPDQSTTIPYYRLVDREAFLAELRQRWGKSEVLELLLELEG